MHRARRNRLQGWQLIAIAATLSLSCASPLLATDATTERVGVTSAAAPGSLLEALMFYGVAACTVGSAIAVCLCKNIVRMAVWLLITLCSVAMLYFLMAANFLGAIQLIVYAGGTLLLLVFGVMLTSKSPWARFEPLKRELLAAGAACLVMLVALTMVLSRSTWSGPEGMVPGASIADLGRTLITAYLVPFEIAGVLLMIVMVGAAHLARQDK